MDIILHHDDEIQIRLKHSLILSPVDGVEELLQLLGGQDTVGKVGVELFKRQLSIVWNTESKHKMTYCNTSLKPG